MATRKNNINSIPSKETLLVSAVAMVSAVVDMFGRATDTYRAFAILLVQLRFHVQVELADGTTGPDWTGKSTEYKNLVKQVYSDAGITDIKTLAKVQSTVRNHVSQQVREVMLAQGATDETFALYEMDELSHNAKQARGTATRFNKTITANPSATVQALTAALLDPKGGDPVVLVTEIHNMVIKLGKAKFDLDKVSEVSALLTKVAAAATALNTRLTGSAPARKTPVRKAA